MRRAPAIAGQQRLDFPAPAISPRPAPPSFGSLIECSALSASLSSRITAFAFDATMVLAGAAIFLVIARLGMKALPLQRSSLFVLGCVLVVLTALYKVLWCLGNGDSPGMRWAKLRLVTFNGRRPSRMQRFQRAASGVLSFAAMGVGLMWALVDEEALTWHDHISKSFPTDD